MTLPCNTLDNPCNKNGQRQFIKYKEWSNNLLSELEKEFGIYKYYDLIYFHICIISKPTKRAFPNRQVFISWCQDIKLFFNIYSKCWKVKLIKSITVFVSQIHLWMWCKHVQCIATVCVFCEQDGIYHQSKHNSTHHLVPVLRTRKWENRHFFQNLPNWRVEE